MAGLFWTLSQGGCLCLPQEAEIQDPVALAQLIERHALSHLLCLPSLYAVLLEQDRARLQSLQVAIVAGESCPPRLPDLHHKRLPRTRLHNEYGPTEATVWSTALEVAPQPARRPVSIGRPIEGVRIALLDEGGEPVPRGVVGEVYIGGAGVARGYFRRPDLTAERFLPDPLRPGRRPSLPHRRSGALAPRWRSRFFGARRPAGQDPRLSHRIGGDRDIVCWRCRRSAIARRWCVKIIPATNVSSPMWCCGHDAGFDPQCARKLRQMLPEYMTPSVFVTLDQLPKNSNGKLDRARLPAPEQSRLRRRDIVAPRNDTEAKLVDVWRQLLRVESIGVEDNFFELGGDSILSIQMVGRARQLGLAVTARQLFDHQTIAALAAVTVAATPIATNTPGQRRRDPVDAYPTLVLRPRLRPSRALDPRPSAGLARTA